MDVVERNSYSRQRFQSLVAFCVSTLIHMVIVLTLAMILITSQGSEGRSHVHVAMQAEDNSSELTQLDVTELVADSASSETPVSVTIPSEVSEIDFRSLLAEGTNSGVGESTGTEQLTSSIGKSLETNESKIGKSASFFGAEAYGNRFVFVIDSSGSMRGARWNALCKELVRAIKSLSPDQEFFVISFDSMAHPMFGTPPPKGKFLKPTKKSVERVQNWIRSIEFGRQTFPSSAVGIAMSLEPDAIFLLSDGEINDSTIRDLRIWNQVTDELGYSKTRTPIHTVLLHSEVGYATLESIANENSGTFTPVKPGRN